MNSRGSGHLAYSLGGSITPRPPSSRRGPSSARKQQALSADLRQAGAGEAGDGCRPTDADGPVTWPVTPEQMAELEDDHDLLLATIKERLARLEATLSKTPDVATRRLSGGEAGNQASSHAGGSYASSRASSRAGSEAGSHSSMDSEWVHAMNTVAGHAYVEKRRILYDTRALSRGSVYSAKSRSSEISSRGSSSSRSSYASSRDGSWQDGGRLPAELQPPASPRLPSLETQTKKRPGSVAGWPASVRARPQPEEQPAAQRRYDGAPLRGLHDPARLTRQGGVGLGFRVKGEAAAVPPGRRAQTHRAG